VAAVSNAGGLGINGAAYMTPDAIRAMIRKVKFLTDKPFGINLFKVSMSLSDPSLNQMQERLDLYCKELSIPKL
jgi:nitronate monooxygenase